MGQIVLYRSVLHQLSLLPVEYLDVVAQFLEKLNRQIQQPQKPMPPEDIEKTMALAGSWSDLSDEDFNEILEQAHETGANMFSRTIEL